MKNSTLTDKQVMQLRCILATHGIHCNWAGADYSTIDALVAKDLVSRQSRPGWHAGRRTRQSDIYRVTELGQQVLCGTALARGMGG